jgi:hypothetical protein
MDKVTQILVEALRQGAAQGGEQRLYRSGKLPGLLPSRTSLHIEAAAQAVRDGLIEIIRSEARGKTVVEWVQVTAKGVQFVLEQDSPVRAMEALHGVLKLNADGLPGWIDGLQRQVDELGRRFAAEVQGLKQQLERLIEHVQQTLKRTDKFGPQPLEGAAGAIPWSHAAVDYLERRREGGMGDKCPLPELFGHVQGQENALTIQDFHHGLRRLHDRGAVRLWPYDGLQGPPEPEYALLDGAMVYWYAAR